MGGAALAPARKQPSPQSLLLLQFPGSCTVWVLVPTPSGVDSGVQV